MLTSAGLCACTRVLWFHVHRRLWPCSVNRSEGRYTLSVVFKGMPTHHKVVLGDDGVFHVNKKPFGQHASLQEVRMRARTCARGRWRM